MRTQFKVIEAFGTQAQIERLTDAAIGIASCTGSVGATHSESNWNQETNETTVTASVTVSRI